MSGLAVDADEALRTFDGDGGGPDGNRRGFIERYGEAWTVRGGRRRREHERACDEGVGGEKSH